MRKNSEYYLGLDCGTESVGFAVTDLAYKVLKFNGKSIWGSRVFDEANTAEERRTHRSARRRYWRKKERIKILQALFSGEITKKDPLFFQRLNDSSYLPEDKTVHQSNSLFDDPDYKDADFFRQYPTIFHLRYALAKGEVIDDPRLLYLALHHIIKNRGHFLFSMSDNFQSVMDLQPLLNDISDISESIYDGSRIGFTDYDQFQRAILKKRITDKKRKLKELIIFDDNKLITIFSDLFSGSNVKPSKLFQNDTYADLPAISFRETSFEDEVLPVLEDSLTEDEYRFVLLFKGVYDWVLLADIMSDSDFISEAKVKQFDKNKKDLAKLKAAVKLHSPNEYKKFFHGIAPGSFSSYIGRTHSIRNERVRRPKSVTDFYSQVRKLIGPNPDDEYSKEILQSIENGTFMPLLISFRNSVIPYQVNKFEMDEILRHASTVFPFLIEKDEDGLTVINKLDSLIKFRIPYYVGPIGRNDKAVSGWAVRKRDGKILPWNLNDMIDIDASAENFIRNMTNKCTYIRTEDVLPRNSLLYSKFLVLNELNNVRINGLRLTVDQKQTVYNELFRKKRKVTQKILIKFIITEGWYRKDENLEITGISGDFKSSLGSYIDFSEYIENKKITNSEAEEIIKWLTLFPDGREIVCKKIQKAFGSKLSKDEIKRISSFQYSGWGRLSKKFLAGITARDKRTGESKTIISMMWATQHNLMELLSLDYEFITELGAEEPIVKLDYKVVDNLQVSPAVKRQIWQTLKIIDEIEHVMGHAPKKVFIEVTRTKGMVEKKTTVSRRIDLLGKLSNMKEPETKALYEILDKTYDDAIVSKRDKLYLYFTQLGKCMYTGKHIEIEDLDNINVYDIDHIYPYSRSDDDSLTNKVLVLKDANAKKGDSFPIDEDTRKQMIPFWLYLLNNDLISKEKFYRLTRTTALDAEDDKGFIARQIVESSQTAKAVAEIIKRYFGNNTKVVYSKARIVSRFRTENDFPKLRALNNLHHAKDAYLNIVVGNVLNTKYTIDFITGRRKNDKYYNLSEPFSSNVQNAWIANENGTILAVRKQMSKNDILYTRQSTEEGGMLFDQMPVAKGSKNGVLPLKMSDPVLSNILANSDDPDTVKEEWTQKYGGYNNLKGSYFTLIRYKNRNKSYVRFVPIMSVDVASIKTKNDIEEYCKRKIGIENLEVIREKVLMGTMIAINGFKCFIAGRTGTYFTVKSAIPLFLDDAETTVLKKIEKFVEKYKTNKNLTVDEKYDGISKKSNIRLYDIFIAKAQLPIYSNRPSTQLEVLLKGRTKFLELTLENQCIVLHNMLLYFGMGNGKADFSLIGGKKNCGIILFSMIFDSNDNLIIYDQSPTGLFVKEEKIKI